LTDYASPLEETDVHLVDISTANHCIPDLAPFLNEVFSSSESGRHNRWSARLLDDAKKAGSPSRAPATGF
jgi:hypothetical protein